MGPVRKSTMRIEKGKAIGMVVEANQPSGHKRWAKIPRFSFGKRRAHELTGITTHHLSLPAALATTRDSHRCRSAV
jgi:hypothetical protein